MPSKNLEKIYASDTFYHVYNRGVEQRNIFTDGNDYRVFLNLLKRYLGREQVNDKYGRLYKNYYAQMELTAFCLMPNHFHLLVFQKEPQALTKFMRSLMTSYVGYFNVKQGRIGNLFQDRFKASNIDNDAYLWHISRYIHLNPLDIKKDWQNYSYSSYRYYTGEWGADWMKPQRILKMHKDYNQDYYSFVSDHKDHKQTLHEISSELAD